MCNLYSMTASREAVRYFARASIDRTDNQLALPFAFPDQLAPVVRIDRDNRRVVEAALWGFPPPSGVGNRQKQLMVTDFPLQTRHIANTK